MTFLRPTIDRKELLKTFCQMHEGWLPDVGKVYTVTLDETQRETLLAVFKDAERYCWLRTGSAATEAAHCGSFHDSLRSGEDLDAAIDAALIDRDV